MISNDAVYIPIWPEELTQSIRIYNFVNNKISFPLDMHNVSLGESSFWFWVAKNKNNFEFL